MPAKPKRKDWSPDEKFVFVMHPWGVHTEGFSRSVPPDIIQSNINNITGWFETMLLNQSSDPDEPIRPIAIYYMQSHQHVVVELPEEVDTDPLLGAHLTPKFLNPPFNDWSTLVSRIYEYNHVLGPPNETQWATGFPSYEKLPRDWPIMDPYPYPPDKCESSHFRQFGKSLPQHLRLPPGERARVIQPKMEPDTSLFRAYEPLLNLPVIKEEEKPHLNKLKGKMDPYEEEENAKEFLKAGLNPGLFAVKKEEGLEFGPLKREEASDLRDRSMTLKSEPGTSVKIEDGLPQPSAELLDLWGQLQSASGPGNQPPQPNNQPTRVKRKIREPQLNPRHPQNVNANQRASVKPEPISNDPFLRDQRHPPPLMHAGQRNDEQQAQAATARTEYLKARAIERDRERSRSSTLTDERGGGPEIELIRALLRKPVSSLGIDERAMINKAKESKDPRVRHLVSQFGEMKRSINEGDSSFGASSKRIKVEHQGP